MDTTTDLEDDSNSSPESNIESNWMNKVESELSMSSFPNKEKYMWTSTYEANNGSEDRHASLVNMILESQDKYCIRMSMWAILDGHGGGAVATYASQALLPHIAVTISRVLETRITNKGEFSVDGELQNVDVLDFEDILRGPLARRKRQRTDCKSHSKFETESHRVSDDSDSDNDDTVGTHSKKEVEAVRRAIHDSFLELDESWMNSIDPAKSQKCCVPDGQWNVGCCVLVACILQRVELHDEMNHEAMLYTAHCGDCRAVLGVHDSKPTSAISDSDDFSDEDSILSSDDSIDLIMNSRLGFIQFPNLRSIDLTTDHNPYNPNEVDLVLKRCKNDPLAISSAVNGGVKRVAGTLAITRALGDAYLKSPRFSFPPYKHHAPYISAIPEISNRILNRNLSDRILIMATDGLWDEANSRDVIQWVQTFFSNNYNNIDHQNRFSNNEFKYLSTPPKTPSDYIIQCTLNRIIRSKNISSLRALMSLKRGRARRCKHDDITVGVIDLAGFVL